MRRKVFAEEQKSICTLTASVNPGTKLEMAIMMRVTSSRGPTMSLCNRFQKRIYLRISGLAIGESDYLLNVPFRIPQERSDA